MYVPRSQQTGKDKDNIKNYEQIYISLYITKSRIQTNIL